MFSAPFSVDTCVPAALILASGLTPAKFCTTIAASTARITSTSSSSIRVKAERRRRTRRIRFGVCVNILGSSLIGPWLLEWALLDQVLQVEHRQQHAYDDRSDHGGHDEQQDRLGDRHQ